GLEGLKLTIVDSIWPEENNFIQFEIDDAATRNGGGGSGGGNKAASRMMSFNEEELVAMPTAFAGQKSSSPEETSEQDSLDVSEALNEDEDEDILSELSSSSFDASRGEPSDEAVKIDGGIEPMEALDPYFGDFGLGNYHVDGAIDDL